MLVSSLNLCCMKLRMTYRHRAHRIPVPFWCSCWEGGGMLSVHIKKRLGYEVFTSETVVWAPVAVSGVLKGESVETGCDCCALTALDGSYICTRQRCCIVATQNSGIKALPSLLAVCVNIAALPRLQISLAQKRDRYIFLVQLDTVLFEHCCWSRLLRIH